MSSRNMGDSFFGFMIGAVATLILISVAIGESHLYTTGIIAKKLIEKCESETDHTRYCKLQAIIKIKE